MKMNNKNVKEFYEVVEKELEVSNFTFNMNKFEIGDVTKLKEVWDGEIYFEVKERKTSYCYDLNEYNSLMYTFKFLEEKEEYELDDLVEILEIEII